MSDLTNYRVTDGVDDVLAAQYNRVLDSTIRAELSNVQALTADKTLTNADYAFQVYAPTAARIVTLPAIGSTNHPFYIVNTSSSYELTIKDAGGVTIGTVAISSSGSFASDGAAWHSFGGGVAPDITLALTHAASSKSPPVDADELPLLDSATSFSLKKLTWANIKAALNSVYLAYVAPGTSGNVLTSNGSAWASSALTASQLASAVAPSTSGNVLTSNGSAWTSAAPSGGVMPNALINGGFDFWQRIAPATATAMTDDVYNAPDRWYSLVQGTNATINRNAGIGTSRYAAKLVAGGTTYRYGIAQIVEASNSIPFRGRTVIAQVGLKPINNAGSGTRKYRIAILEWTGTADVVTSELVADWTSGTFTTAGFFASTTKKLVGTASVTATHNSETVLSVSGTVSTSCNNLIVFFWAEDVPTNAADYVLIGEAGLYDGTTAQSWHPRDIATELSLCQRYYEKSFPVDDPPVQNAGNAYGAMAFFAYTTAAYQLGPTYSYKSSKRSTGVTITFYNPFAAGTGWSASGSGNYASNTYVLGDNALCARCDAVVPIGANMSLHWTSEAEL